MTAICTICNRTFQDARGLAGHLKIVHQVNAKEHKGYPAMRREGQENTMLLRVLALDEKLKELQAKRKEIEGRRKPLIQLLVEGGWEKAELRSKMISAIKLEEKVVQKELGDLCDQLNQVKEEQAQPVGGKSEQDE